MLIDFWSENPNNCQAINDLSRLCNKKEIEWYLNKLEKYEQYTIEQLFKAEIIKRIQNWSLYEIRIKNKRFIGDIYNNNFYIFTVEKKQSNKLPNSAFLKASNIRNTFLLRKR